MNDQTGRLVDNGKVLVLEYEREGDGGGLERSGRFVVRDPNRHHLTPGKEPGSAGDLSIDCDPLVCNQAGSLGPGDSHLVGEKPVEAFGCQTENGELDCASGIGLGPGV
jgi:hypothetical protein